jgi:hypothetical protein
MNPPISSLGEGGRGGQALVTAGGEAAASGAGPGGRGGSVLRCFPMLCYFSSLPPPHTLLGLLLSSGINSGAQLGWGPEAVVCARPQLHSLVCCVCLWLRPCLACGGWGGGISWLENPGVKWVSLTNIPLCEYHGIYNQRIFLITMLKKLTFPYVRLFLMWIT